MRNKPYCRCFGHVTDGQLLLACSYTKEFRESSFIWNVCFRMAETTETVVQGRELRQLGRGESLPVGAKLLSDLEAIEAQEKIVKNWTPKSDV
jgi:hypothetical protein